MASTVLVQDVWNTVDRNMQRRILTAVQTAATLGAFFLAIVLHPDVLEKAQAEIDEVIGTDRLPDIGDRNLLPYTESLVREVFR